MVQEPNQVNLQRLGLKRSYNHQQGATTSSSSDIIVGQNVVYNSLTSNNESIKRQKCQKSLENVQNEKETTPVDSTSSSPKLSCISLESLKTHLECPVCLTVPKVGPIYQCRNGHLLCKECHPKMKCCPLCQIPLERLRNLLSEQLVSMIYPEYQFSADRSAARTREVIWKGQLHWRENPPRPGLQNPTPQQQRVERSVNLSISTAMENGVPEVLPMNWPTSLVMQTIPISLINRTGKQFFSNSRTVLFHPSEEESLNSLTNLLSNGSSGGSTGTSGLAGCVHFSGVPNCDVKVLILLYSPGKKVFLGFIPNDQNTFVERIREEIRKEKSKRDILAKMNAHNAAVVGGHVVTSSAAPSSQQPLLQQQPSLIQQQL